MVLNKKITILQVLPDLNSGGVERGTLEVNKYLANNGHRTLVVSNGGRMVKELREDKGEHFKLGIGKKNILSNKKRLFSKLQDKKSVTKVFEELSKRYSSRKGGYSRVLKAGFRTGDDAPMAVIELVDRNPEAKKVDKPKKTETKEKTKEVQTEPKKVAKK